MDDRKRRVLRAIIDDYIHTGEPVGSRTVARTPGLGVSAATIRNEMADLEDMGYLEQPHTSAGRVPSDKGYRFYVDTLVADVDRGALDREAVRQVLALKAQRLRVVVRQSAHLLSETTEFLGIASQPTGPQERLAALQFVPLDGNRLVIVLVADNGTVRNKVVQFQHPPTRQDMEAIGQALSDRLRGSALGEFGKGDAQHLATELGQFRDVLTHVQSLLGEPREGERVLMDGTTNLLQQPEFRDVAKARRVLHALEQEALVADLVGRLPAPGGGLEVAIGHELQVEGMDDCALVTAVYAMPGGVLGRVGVLGPRRMDYGRVMNLVEGVATAITRTLGGSPPPRQAASPNPPEP
jgi:heat-inducible transcriptional repressor